MTTPSFRDIEKLSAYLDGQLSQAESARLEARIEIDPLLRAALDSLREARKLLHRLPHRRTPRNFTLTPRMAGLRSPTPRAVPVFRYAAALAALLFAFTFVPSLLPRMSAAAPMVVYGIGGGPAPEEPTPSADMNLEAVPPAMAPGVAMPTIESVTSERSMATPIEESSTLAPSDKIPVETPLPRPSPSFSLTAWQTGLVVSALLSVFIAFGIRWNSERLFRSKINK